jgi:hypothetical protein
MSYYHCSRHRCHLLVLVKCILPLVMLEGTISAGISHDRYIVSLGPTHKQSDGQLFRSNCKRLLLKLFCTSVVAAASLAKLSARMVWRAIRCSLACNVKHVAPFLFSFTLNLNSGPQQLVATMESLRRLHHSESCILDLLLNYHD